MAEGLEPRARWDGFRAEYPRLVGEDVELACYAYQARLAQGDAEAHAEARALFIAGREAPRCEPVFAALARQAPSARRRCGSACRAARRRRVREGARTRCSAEAWRSTTRRSIARAPIRRDSSPEKSRSQPRGSKELAIHAVDASRARKPDEAAERLAAGGRLGPDDAATRGARWPGRRRSRTIRAPSTGTTRQGDAPLTDAQVAWRARAALRAGEWKAVLAAILRLSPEEAREQRMALLARARACTSSAGTRPRT